MRKLAAIVFILSIINQSIFAASPSLGSIIPKGETRNEVDLNFNGDRLSDAVEILFTHLVSESSNSLQAAALNT